VTTVAQILKHKGPRVFTVLPQASVREALALLAEHDIGALVVVDERGAIVGIFSERDYARRGVLAGRRSETTAVREIMSPHPVTVRPEADLEECMRLMTERRLRHLPVLGREGALVGLVSIGDVVKSLLDDFAAHIRSLESYISGRG
jgi:CBS domain-containing protein